MNWNTFVALQPVFVSVILPALGAMLLSLYHRMPLKRQEFVAATLRNVVLGVEQLGLTEQLTSEQKKGLALDAAQSLLKHAGVSVPQSDLSMLIEGMVAETLNAEKLLSGTPTPVAPIGFAQIAPLPATSATPLDVLLGTRAHR